MSEAEREQAVARAFAALFTEVTGGNFGVVHCHTCTFWDEASENYGKCHGVEQHEFTEQLYLLDPSRRRLLGVKLLKELEYLGYKVEKER